MNHSERVSAYFSAWLHKDPSLLPLLFSEDVIYSECYGPEYRGLSQILRWFADWNLRGTVLQWDIKNVLEQDDMLCVEWYFCCEYDGVIDEFDGVSWIEFDDCGKMQALREFQSKAKHHFPYGEG